MGSEMCIRDRSCCSIIILCSSVRGSVTVFCFCFFFFFWFAEVSRDGAAFLLVVVVRGGLLLSSSMLAGAWPCSRRLRRRSMRRKGRGVQSADNSRGRAASMMHHTTATRTIVERCVEISHFSPTSRSRVQRRLSLLAWLP